jgi:predicted transposase/invertase (TIGR01784 family)
LDPKLDIVFWMLFGAEQNRALLLSLLNAVLKPPEPIVFVEVRHAQPERSAVDDKSIALDLRVQLTTGEQVDVEMQTQHRPAQRERALYYWSRLYAGQLLRGARYEELVRCVVVLIANFHELSSPRFIRFFRCETSRTVSS